MVRNTPYSSLSLPRYGRTLPCVPPHSLFHSAWQLMAVKGQIQHLGVGGWCKHVVHGNCSVLPTVYSFVSSLQMTKLRHREILVLCQGHRTSKCQTGIWTRATWLQCPLSGPMPDRYNWAAWLVISFLVSPRIPRVAFYPCIVLKETWPRRSPFHLSPCVKLPTKFTSWGENVFWVTKAQRPLEMLSVHSLSGAILVGSVSQSTGLGSVTNRQTWNTRKVCGKNRIIRAI